MYVEKNHNKLVGFFHRLRQEQFSKLVFDCLKGSDRVPVEK